MEETLYGRMIHTQVGVTVLWFLPGLFKPNQKRLMTACWILSL